MTTKDEALFLLDASEVRAGQRWKHTKTGGVYAVVATGIAEATHAPVVIYAGHDGVIWVRSLEVFLSNNDEGKPRFVLLEEEVEATTNEFERPCCLASKFPPGHHSVDCSMRSLKAGLAELRENAP